MARGHICGIQSIQAAYFRFSKKNLCYPEGSTVSKTTQRQEEAVYEYEPVTR